MTIVHTKSGRAFDVVKIDPDAIDIEDIAWSLAHQCRYNGHVTRFYSVAEHSYKGAILAAAYGWAVQRAFLLHDAAEAYIGDIIAPIKNHPAVKERLIGIEAPLLSAIYRKFDVEPVSGSVALIDRRMCAIEVSQLVTTPLTGDWPDEVREPAPFHGLDALGDDPKNARAGFLRMAQMLGIG